MPSAPQPQSLESLLNVVWVLLTLVGAVVCVIRSSFVARLKTPHCGTALIALGCAAAIVFPAISVSDDLHTPRWAIEDTSLAAKKVKSLVRCYLHTPQAAPLGQFLASSADPTWQTMAWLPAEKAPEPCYFCVLPSAGRAPPFPAEPL